MLRRLLVALAILGQAATLPFCATGADGEALSPSDLKKEIRKNAGWIIGIGEQVHAPCTHLAKYEERGDVKTALVELIKDARAEPPGEVSDDRLLRVCALYLGFARDNRLVKDALIAIREASKLDRSNELTLEAQATLAMWLRVYACYAVLGEFEETREPIRQLLLTTKDWGVIADFKCWALGLWPDQKDAHSLAAYDWWLGVLREVRKRPEFDNDPEWKKHWLGHDWDLLIRDWEKGREEYLKAHPEQATGTPGTNGGGTQNPPPPVGPDDGQSLPGSGPTTPRDGGSRPAPADRGAGDNGVWPLWAALAAIAVAAAILAMCRTRAKPAESVPGTRK